MYKMDITQEIAEQDLEKTLRLFSTKGSGSEQDRAAQMILQNLAVLQEQLDSPQLIKKLYLDNPDAKNEVPEIAYNVVKEYVNGQINQEQATVKLTEASKQYVKVFAELGLKPTKIKALFMI